MNVSIFDNRRVRQGLTIVLLVGSLACIFPPKHPAFQWWAAHAVFVAFGFLLAGLFFLIVNKSRLMFVCLGCSAAISFIKNEMKEGPAWESRAYPLVRPAPPAGASQPQPDSLLFLKTAPQDESSKTSQ